MAIVYSHIFNNLAAGNQPASFLDDNFNNVNSAIDIASGIAGLDANNRVNRPANTVYDGTGNRSATPVPTANSIPVANASGVIRYLAQGISLYAERDGNQASNSVILGFGTVFSGKRILVCASATVTTASGGWYSLTISKGIAGGAGHFVHNNATIQTYITAPSGVTFTNATPAVSGIFIVDTTGNIDLVATGDGSVGTTYTDTQIYGFILNSED